MFDASRITRINVRRVADYADQRLTGRGLRGSMSRQVADETGSTFDRRRIVRIVTAVDFDVIES